MILPRTRGPPTDGAAFYLPARRLVMLALALSLICCTGWMMLALVLPPSLATFEHYAAQAGPRPLLDLALERYAGARGELVGRDTVKVERYDAVVSGASTSARWQVVACFFKADAGFGRCARLVLSVRTMPDASPPLPPTQWPYVVESEVALDAKPTTEQLLLLPGA